MMHYSLISFHAEIYTLTIPISRCTASVMLPPSPTIGCALVFVLDLSQWGNVDDADEITLRRPMDIFDHRSCQY